MSGVQAMRRASASFGISVMTITSVGQPKRSARERRGIDGGAINRWPV
jgi:hypothetical protein